NKREYEEFVKEDYTNVMPRKIGGGKEQDSSENSLGREYNGRKEPLLSPVCDDPAPASSKFCSNCGAKKNGGKFCSGCGTSNMV
ncbi:hypothetical protein TrRE_jg4843, partial [Triparma retinervis]